MDPQLHLGLRGLAHAEAARVNQAAIRLGEALAAQAAGVHARIREAPIQQAQAQWFTAVPPRERDAALGRSLVRLVVAAASPELSGMVSELAGGLTAEAERLNAFADTVDLLLNTPAAPASGTLRGRIGAVREGYHQLTKPTTDVAWAEHAALRQTLAAQLGLAAVVQHLLAGRGDDPATRLASTSEACLPGGVGLRIAMTELSQRLALRLLDAVDVHLDAAAGTP